MAQLLGQLGVSLTCKDDLLLTAGAALPGRHNPRDRDDRKRNDAELRDRLSGRKSGRPEKEALRSVRSEIRYLSGLGDLCRFLTRSLTNIE